MSIEVARSLFDSGRAHGLSAQLLYRAALNEGQQQGVPDPNHFAFNGTYSLSIYNLSALCFELVLKGASIVHGGDPSEQALKRLGHNLTRCLAHAKALGFDTNAPMLGEIIAVLDEPYRSNFLRYQRPDRFALPDLMQVFECLEVLDEELRAVLY